MTTSSSALAQRTAAVSQADSAALRRAERRAEAGAALGSGDFDRAIVILRNLAREPTSTAADWLILADILAARANDSMALSWYQRTYSDRARLTGSELLQAIRGIASTEMRIQRPLDALSFLLNARAHGEIAERNPTVLYLLGVAWKATKQRARARCALASAIEAAPLEAPAWTEWQTVGGASEEMPLQSAERWECPTFAGIMDVLKLGPASKWKSEDVILRSSIYLKVSDSLAAQHMDSASIAFRRAAWWIPYFHGRRLIRQSTSEESADSSLAFLAFATAVQPKDLDAGRRAGVLQDIVAGYRRLGKFDHAMAAATQLFSLCQLGSSRLSPCKIDSIPSPPYRSHFTDPDSSTKQVWDKVLEINTQILGRLLTDAFIYISWDRRTAQLRDNDPGNFMGHMVQESDTDRSAVRRAKPPRKDERRIPYGQTSIDEDRVTVQTAVMMQQSELPQLLASAMRRKNYGLVTKVLIANLIAPMELGIVPDLAWAKRGDLYGVRLADLDTLARSSTAPGLSQETQIALRTALDAIELLLNIHKWYAGTLNLASTAKH